MICCGIDCKSCDGTPCSERHLEIGCPAKCNPEFHIAKGLCTGCKTFKPDSISKKEARRQKIEDRKKWR